MTGADLIDLLEEDVGGEAVWKFAYLDGGHLRLGSFSIERSATVRLPSNFEGFAPVAFRCLGEERAAGGNRVVFDLIVHPSGRFAIGNIQVLP